MTGPQPDRQQGLLVGLHGVKRARLVIDGITWFYGEPGSRPDLPVAIAADNPVTFLGVMEVRRIVCATSLQAKTRDDIV